MTMLSKKPTTLAQSPPEVLKMIAAREGAVAFPCCIRSGAVITAVQRGVLGVSYALFRLVVLRECGA
jgi:hypothetical protein